MAGIDKIYITEEQLPFFKHWVKKVSDKCLQETGYNIMDYVYNLDIKKVRKDYMGVAEFPVSNFPEEIDRWILNGNCGIDFILNRVKFQYGIE